MHSNSHYNKHLRHLARSNRGNMNKAEVWIWKYVLSKRQMMGYQFRRQRPIDSYIVDFVCLPIKLIIEVDGFSHQIPEVEIRDKIRQQRLESLGFKVIRFTNQEVYQDLDLVRTKVEQVIMDLVGGGWV